MSEKITFKGKYGTLLRVGKLAGIKFSDEEIKGFVKEEVSGNIADGYPESIYTTAGKSEFTLDDYTLAYWLKAQMEDGRIERDVIQITRNIDEVVCVGRVEGKKDFENICNTLLVFPRDYDLEYDANEGTLYTTANKVVMQNIFFENVNDALKYQEQQEEEEIPMEEGDLGGIPEVSDEDFEELLSGGFGGDSAPLEEGMEPGVEEGGGLPPLE